MSLIDKLSSIEHPLPGQHELLPIQPKPEEHEDTLHHRIATVFRNRPFSKIQCHGFREHKWGDGALSPALRTDVEVWSLEEIEYVDEDGKVQTGVQRLVKIWAYNFRYIPEEESIVKTRDGATFTSYAVTKNYGPLDEADRERRENHIREITEALEKKMKPPPKIVVMDAVEPSSPSAPVSRL